MYWLISLWLYNVISIKAFILQDTYNVLLKDDKDYKVDLMISDDDYEMIDEKHLKEFKIDKEKYKFKELDEIARSENFEVFKVKAKMVKQPYEPSLQIISAKGNEEKKLTMYPEPRSITKTNKRQIETETEETYDYDELVNEYNDEANEESQSSNAYHMSKAVNTISQYGIWNELMKLLSFRSDVTNCSYVDGIGLIAMKCLIEDYINHRYTLRDVMARLWRIFFVWFLVYLAVAIPLWCTRGWCCCCLCCKFFKPRQTIEEAKRYVVLYPPGIFKTKSGEILYEPTEREKECYEEFQHFIKIL
ncbi:unnamed protein product [Spodoptera littoralis]|uniref:Uncharacterized protein n=1 Tax=Spodoptera littoralis TaxID=7109 RepID=A0A9P0I1E3_SPOLI|nr:unnamed protein product [Spodoptera littoralis]CAH1637661.1 unnamed protein product [Spodoptera littoralis]